MNSDKTIIPSTVNLDDTPEVIILDDDETDEKQKPMKEKPKNNKTDEIRKPMKDKPSKKNAEHKRKVKIDKCKNVETLIVSQKVKVKKQKIECIINLTNVCEHKEKTTKKSQTKIVHKTKSSCKERIVPMCLRAKCKAALNSKSKCCRSTIKWRHCKTTIHTDTRKLNENRSCTKKTRHRHTCRRKYSKVRSETNANISKVSNKNKEHSTKNVFSPISSSPFSDRDKLSLTYENISTDNLSSCSEVELDTLIRRAKEREKQSFRDFLGTPLGTSTPGIENEDIYYSNSDMDISLHSLTTLVIGQTPDTVRLENEAYSPTMVFSETYSPLKNNLARDLIYSPTMSPENCFLEHSIMHSPVMKCKEKHVKNENYVWPSSFEQFRNA